MRYTTPFHLMLLLITLSIQTSAQRPTPIYLDLVPGYSNLSSCAVTPLSTLIREMWNGCGDGGALTSYSCFCTDSYSKFGWDISTAIISTCGLSMTAQVTSAVAVFSTYCASGMTQLISSTAVVAASPTATASLSVTAATLTSEFVF